jgi:hypothetical protein
MRHDRLPPSTMANFHNKSLACLTSGVTIQSYTPKTYGDCTC